MVEVTYLGKLRRLAGVISERICQTTISEVLNELSGGHSSEFGRLLFVNNDASLLNGDVEILVNGRNIKFLNGLATIVNKDDKVTMLYHGARGFPGG